MDNKKSNFLIAVILVLVAAVSIYAFAGGFKGQSAYELAVKNGFNGTQTEWLASLKGNDGSNGQSIDYEALYNKALQDGTISPDTTLWQFISQLLADTTSQTMQQSINKALTSCVSIYAVCQDVPQSGSGVIIKLEENGTAYILTNYHVTYFSGSNLHVPSYYIMLYQDNYMFDQGSSYIMTHAMQATYLGGSKTYDIAILKLTDSRIAQGYENGSITAVTFAESDNLYVGQPCYAIGNSLGFCMSVSDGVISVIDESYSIEDVTNSNKNVNLHGTRFTAPINAGNSGGGLFNLQGEVIGIVDAKKTSYNSGTENVAVDGMALALPASTVKNVANQILKQCNGTTKTTPNFVSLGFTTQCAGSSCISAGGNTTVSYSLSISNITKVSVRASGLAEGDIINSVSIINSDGSATPVTLHTTNTLNDLVLGLSSGTKLSISYTRTNGTFNTSGTAVITL